METILNFLPLTDEERKAFEEAAEGAEQIFLPADTIQSRIQADPALLSRATIILGNVPPAQVATATKLKWMQTWSAGVDPYLAPGVLAEGAKLSGAAGAYGQSVSEVMFASMLGVMKHLPAYRDQQSAHVWRDCGPVKTPVGATIVVLGTGDLGGHFARLVKAMGAKTIGVNRSPNRVIEGFDALIPLNQLDEVLPQADVVAITLPAAPETYHLFDAEHIAQMKADAILINAGRGNIVDNLALAQALKGGHLWGAALDVTEPEPLPADHPLWDCPNLLLTPHVAGGNHLEVTPRNVAAIALENLKNYLAGRPLRNRMK